MKDMDMLHQTHARIHLDNIRFKIEGIRGEEEITCEEWARVLQTITYEVTCQINARVERIFV